MLNLIGLVKLRSGKFNESLEQFSKGLEINEAINFYKKSAEIKDDYYLAYYNLGNAYIGKADFKNAILNFDQTLKIKEDFVEARNNIIQSLTYYNSSNLNSVIYSKINNDLQNLKFNYEKSKNINVKDIKKYFENCMEIVNKSIPHLEYKFSQIYNGTSSVTAPLMATPRQQTGTTNSPSIEGAVFGGVSPPFRDATEEFTSETTAANIETFSSS